MRSSYSLCMVSWIGASSGIGRGTAIEFASRGSKLALIGRNENNLVQTKEECLKVSDGSIKDEDILLIKADLSQEQDTIRAVKETVSKFNRIDVLVNAAGIIGKGTVESTPLSDYDVMMNINLRSVFHIMSLSIPHLKSTKGSIVNVSSVTGLRAVSLSTSKLPLSELPLSELPLSKLPLSKLPLSELLFL